MVSLRLVALGAVTGAVIPLMGGCGSHAADPPASSFAAGTCRQAAPAVLSIGQLARGALQHSALDASGLSHLTADQSRLRALQRSAATADQARLQPLVTAIGFYRLHAVGNSVSPVVTRAVVTAQHLLVRSCVAGSRG